MISIRGHNATEILSLPVLPEAVLEQIQEWYDNGRQPDFLEPGRTGLTTETGRKIGSLYWPIIGASRWAYGTFVIDANTLGLLRQQMGDSAAVTLRYSDAVTLDDLIFETPREFPLYLIGSRPISRPDQELISVTVPPPAADHLYLITLVDKRWYWANTNGFPGSGCQTVPETWAQLFGKFQAALGETLNVDSIPGAYDSPGPDWVQAVWNTRGTAHMLDEAAWGLGMRVVTVPVGGVSVTSVQRPEDEYYLSVSDFFVSNADRLSGGGWITNEDNLRGLPQRVRVVDRQTFLDYTALTGGTGPGNVLVPTSIPDGSLSSVRIALAGQWRDDFVAWSRAPLDAVYAGFVLPPLSGFLGSVELYHDAGIGYTRITRPALDWMPNNADAHDPRFGFFAALTTESGGKWKWIAQTLDDAGIPIDDGEESEEYNAVPHTVDGQTYGIEPYEGQRVWMIPSKQCGLYEFLSTDTGPSLVDVKVCLTQLSGVYSIAIEKTYSDGTVVCDKDPTGCCPDPSPTQGNVTWQCVSSPQAVVGKYTGSTISTYVDGCVQVDNDSGLHQTLEDCLAACESASCAASHFDLGVCADVTVIDKTGTCVDLIDSFLLEKVGDLWNYAGSLTDSAPAHNYQLVQTDEAGNCWKLQSRPIATNFTTTFVAANPATLTVILDVTFNVGDPNCVGTARLVIIGCGGDAGGPPGPGGPQVNALKFDDPGNLMYSPLLW